MVAQLSSIIMQYIDASMVGSLGAAPSASIGLVSTSTWLFGGMCGAASAGFYVQVAHKIGSGDEKGAREVMRGAFVAVGIFGLALSFLGVSISGVLPRMLGGDISICHESSLYFLIYSLSLPVLQMISLSSGMLRCSGNMKVPSALGVTMCALDVVLNFFLIFPSRSVAIGSASLFVPGAGLGVVGAALGTAIAEAIVAVALLWYLCAGSKTLKIVGERGSFRPKIESIKKALHIGLPVGVEHFFICGAQIMTTVIVAPLGVVAIAANSFAVTAESLCYMPGYGIGDAATTLVGQSLGAGRRELMRSFARITVGLGMVCMAVMGAVMYLAAPQLMAIMSPVEEIRQLGTTILRIEAYAEPMFAASIVAYGVFVGAADTLVPCLMNFLSIWAVRLSLAALLAPRLGLKGVWIAMCAELCFRGLIFLIRMQGKAWQKKIGGNLAPSGN